jgi:hypothetical protein
MLGSVRLSASEFTSRPWRIHEVCNGFRVLDVWALPTPGEHGDFPRLLHLWSTFDATKTSPVVRGLFAIRWAVGRLLRLDRPEAGLGGRVRSLRDRMPAELPEQPMRLRRATSPFAGLYVTADEFAMEIANATVHGVLHIGWVADGPVHRGQMTVLVRPNGVLGHAYLAAIAPFRHLVVYPLMMRDIDRLWREPALPQGNSEDDDDERHDGAPDRGTGW